MSSSEFGSVDEILDGDSFGDRPGDLHQQKIATLTEWLADDKNTVDAGQVDALIGRVNRMFQRYSVTNLGVISALLRIRAGQNVPAQTFPELITRATADAQTVLEAQKQQRCSISYFQDVQLACYARLLLRLAGSKDLVAQTLEITVPALNGMLDSIKEYEAYLLRYGQLNPL